jgi:hypothetical protein
MPADRMKKTVDSVSTASPQPKGKSPSTFVASALALDELIEWFGMILVLQGVPQNS